MAEEGRKDFGMECDVVGRLVVGLGGWLKPVVSGMAGRCFLAIGERLVAGWLWRLVNARRAEPEERCGLE
ncbi:MAG: hypothetical protein ACYS1A_17245, partial [Planctomycetota bacterium]